MQLLRSVGTLVVALGFCLPSSVSADELVERLTAIPGLSIVGEQPAPAGYRFLVMTFEQQVNHPGAVEGNVLAAPDAAAPITDCHDREYVRL